MKWFHLTSHLLLFSSHGCYVATFLHSPQHTVIYLPYSIYIYIRSAYAYATNPLTTHIKIK